MEKIQERMSMLFSARLRACVEVATSVDFATVAGLRIFSVTFSY